MRRAQPWLGTLVEVCGEGEADALAAGFDAAFAAVARVHRLMSFHDAASDVGRFNRAHAGACLDIDAHTWRVLALTREIETLSAGTFDAACAPLLAVSGHLPRVGAPPPFISGRAVFSLEREGRRWRVHKLAPAWLDLGGIAKGYAVDLAVAALRQAGVAAGCVNAGGDLRAFGPRAFPVRLRDPAAPARMRRQVMLRERALATSAPYFSLRETEEGPASALRLLKGGGTLLGTRSISVLAPSCAAADALTKVVAGGAAADCAALRHFGASVLA